MSNENIDERIRKIQDKIEDARDYISSDFCSYCMNVYEEIRLMEEELQKLYDTQNQ